MYIKPFAVEEWMNEWEVGARYNIAETCVDSVSLDELFALTGAFVTPGDCFEQPKSMRIGYAYGKKALVNGLKAVSEYFAWKEKELEK